MPLRSGAMTDLDYSAELSRRLEPPKPGFLDIDSPLSHFALITYAVPVERLTPHIPTDLFEIPAFDIDGEPRALLSVVPFIDSGFRFRMLPFVRFHFAQTNYRVYVVNRNTGQPCVWFFGTTLGGWPVHLARWLWKIPWRHARYRWECDYDEASGRYRTFRYSARSGWAPAEVNLRDTGRPTQLQRGFMSADEMTLILTHPIDGFFYRTDGKLGTYSVSHAVLELTEGEAVDLSFPLLERLGVLTSVEAKRPHSVLIARDTRFQIHMPPRKVKKSQAKD